MTDEVPPPSPWGAMSGDPRSTPRWGGPTPEPLDDVRKQLAALEGLERERIGAARTLRVIWLVFGGTITAATIAIAGWLWTLQASAVTTTASVERVSERLDDHQKRGGPQGHPESVISRTIVNEGRIGSIERSLSMLEATLARQDSKLDQVLARLPRRSQ